MAQLKKATAKNDYVRVRYMVTEEPSDISAEKATRLVEAVRDCVRQALGYDDLGMPIPPDSGTEEEFIRHRQPWPKRSQ